MFLTTEDKRMLDGAHGPGVQRAMDLLVKLGESFDSEKMTELSYVHAIYDVIPQDYWDLITEGATKGLKVTTHPAFQPEKWKQLGITHGPGADTFIDAHNKKLDKVRELGWLITDTCAEYLLGIVPGLGDAVVMHGSCMQIASNSLFGARVARTGIFCSLASAICGKAPVMDLMIPENRFAEILVDVKALDVKEWTDAHYSCLGYYIGNQVGGMKNIAINGLPKHLPFDFKRALILPLPTSGAITLAHIVGNTPEAPTLEDAFGSQKPKFTIEVKDSDLVDTWHLLNPANSDNNVEHVAFGCPHCTIDEIGQIASMLEGRVLKVPLIIGASVPVVALAREQGWAQSIEKAGGHFLSACPSINNPFARPDIAGENQVKCVATDSARAAHYLSRISGVRSFFGTKKQCIEAGLTGKWKGECFWK